MLYQVMIVTSLLGALLGSGCEVDRLPEVWPPEVGKPYPDMEFYDHRGEKVSLASLKGKVLFVELIGMPCAGCQAFSGGHKVGGFGNVRPQSGLGSIDKYFRTYSRGLSLDDERIAYVQILFYNLEMGAPTVEDARAWARHFDLDKRKNCYVLAGTKAFVRPETYEMIPGFHLVDKNFVLRSDATGAKQGEVFSKTIPMVRRLLAEKETAVTAGM